MIKKLDEPDKSKVRDWWTRYSIRHGDPIGIPNEMLQDGYGAFIDDELVVATWVYQNGFIAWIAWTTANPEITGGKRSEACKELFEYVDKMNKEMGVKISFAASNNGSLVTRFMSDGYHKQEEDNVHMYKVLK